MFLRGNVCGDIAASHNAGAWEPDVFTCRSLGACATRGGQAKSDLHCRRIPNPGFIGDVIKKSATNEDYSRLYLNIYGRKCL